MPRKKPDPASKPSAVSSKSDPVFQFKITLVGSKPPIWRRIMVEDGTLDDLHRHIQSAMGWHDGHLHQFEIGHEIYGNPDILDDGFGESECLDSTRTKISRILPKGSAKFKFAYEYDFGDSWRHTIEFEGRKDREPDGKYPQCLAGARGCPPEDVGGIYGYYDLLEALADPNHERHEELLEWNGPFDPEKFDAAETTAYMQQCSP